MTIPYKRAVLCQATHQNLPQIWQTLVKEAEMYPSIMQKGSIKYITVINIGFGKITTHYSQTADADRCYTNGPSQNHLKITHIKITSPVCRNTCITWLFTPSYSFPEDTILFICLLTYYISPLRGSTSDGEVPLGWPQQVYRSIIGHTAQPKPLLCLGSPGVLPTGKSHPCLFPQPWKGRQPSSMNGPSYMYMKQC